MPGIILRATGDFINSQAHIHASHPTGIGLPCTSGTAALLCKCVCEGLDLLALPNKELIPKLQTKFFPLHTCQQLELIYRVSRAANGWRFFLHIATPLTHEVPAVSYIGANATASHTSKSEKKAKNDHDYT